MKQPLWAWTQKYIKIIDKPTPIKCRKGRIKRFAKKAPIWNNINVPKSMIDPTKQFVVNDAHLATQLDTTDIIKASTVTTPQTWNRTKFTAKLTVKGHKNVVIKTKERMMCLVVMSGLVWHWLVFLLRCHSFCVDCCCCWLFSLLFFILPCSEGCQICFFHKLFSLHFPTNFKSQASHTILSSPHGFFD